MTDPAASFYEFGPFRLDAVKRLLLQEGRVVPLPPKALDTLLVLIANSNRVVEKRELMDAIWPDSFVEEANLTQNVSILRKALGERADEHRYVVTVPGRGYRFVANLARTSDRPADRIPRTQAIMVAEPEEGTVACEEIEAHRPSARGRTFPETIQQARIHPRLNPGVWTLSALSLVILIGTVSYFLISGSSPRPHGILEVKSIAVLPFKLLGPEESDEYLGLGMADTLITSLSGINQLIVRPTSAMRKYTDGNQDPLAAGREQRVDAVLDGSIHKAEGKIRLTARLINVHDGSSLWAGRFDERYEDIFRMQDSIVERIAGALTPKLTGEEQQKLAKRYTENLDAYHAYLKGRYYWNRRTADGIRKAIEQFQQAIERDPNYALGYVGLADSYAALGEYAGVPPDDALPKAEAAAYRALQLDDSLAEAHTSLAMVYRNQWRWADAEKEYRRAISLNPNYPTAHQWFGFYYITKRQFDDALTQARRAQDLDPLSPIITDQVALVYLLKNDVNSAVEQIRRNMELNPSFPGTHYLLGSAYLKQRRHEEAIAEFQKAVELSGRASVWLGALGYGYAVSGKRIEALRLVKELEGSYARREALGAHLATVYAGLGEKDQAFAWLEKDFELGGGSPFITSNYSYEGLRSDPRYANLLRRIGLQP